MDGPGQLASDDKASEPVKRRRSLPIAIKRSVTRNDRRQERAHPIRELGHEVAFLTSHSDIFAIDKEVILLYDQIVDGSVVGSAKEHILSRLLEIQEARDKAAAERTERRLATNSKQTTCLRGDVSRTAGDDESYDVDGATIIVDVRPELDVEIELFELDM